MRALVAIAAAEVRQRWTVLAAALLAGMLALAVPLFSALGKRDVREARELAALVFAAAFALGVAVVVGAGMISRELIERRHGFLFSRPLPARAIWGGKVLACWLLAMGSGAAALLPAAVASRGVHLLGSVSPWGDAATMLAVAAAVLLALVGYSHAIALMVRSRASWLLALDVVLAVGVVTTIALAARALALAFALDALRWACVAIAAAALIAALVAGFVQVSRGRTDIRRGHLALSATLWGILGAVALSVAGYAYWLQAVEVGDLTMLTGLRCAPSGNWVFVTGQARGRGDYRPSFLLDTASGRSIKLGAAGEWWMQERFSEDGSRVVWLSPPADATKPVRDVVTIDLTEPGSRPVTTPITISQAGGTILALSPDGRHVVVRDAKNISVTELLSGRILASARVPDGVEAIRALWPRSDAVRLVAWGAQQENGDHGDLRIFELDVRTRTMIETGRIRDVARRGFWYMAFDPRLGRVVVRTGTGSSGSLVLADARTGSTIATLDLYDPISSVRVAFLAGGTVAIGDAVDSAARLRLFSPAGTPGRTVQLGSGRLVNLAAQPTAETLVVTTRNRTDDYSASGGVPLLVNVATGTVTPLAKGLRPLGWSLWWAGVSPPVPGSLAARAFIDPAGRFAILDPATSTFRTVLAARWHAD